MQTLHIFILTKLREAACNL